MSLLQGGRPRAFAGGRFPTLTRRTLTDMILADMDQNRLVLHPAPPREPATGQLSLRTVQWNINNLEGAIRPSLNATVQDFLEAHPA